LRFPHRIVIVALCRNNPALIQRRQRGTTMRNETLEMLACMAVFALWGVMLALGV
jgi:hypothetical protein